MNKNNITITILACFITAVLVSIEVFFWQDGSIVDFMPTLPFSTNNLQVNPLTKTFKSSTNFDEIKTKEEGVAICEQNITYGKTIMNTEQKQIALGIADYCYTLIAGKFNDLTICQRALEKNNCLKAAQELIDMGKEIQNMSPEEKEQMQNAYKNIYKGL